MANFTLLDIFGILRALPFFAMLFLAPGYCLGRICGQACYSIRQDNLQP